VWLPIVRLCGRGFALAAATCEGAWKVSVLPHFLLHLRYIHDEALVTELQVALTRSLETCLLSMVKKTAILAEMAIPPLHYTQHAQLAQFSYRLSSRTSNVIPHVLWAKLALNTDQLPRASLDRRMRASTLYLDPDPGDCAMPPSMAHAGCNAPVFQFF